MAVKAMGLFLAAVIASTVTVPSVASAQDSSRISELYHIFDIKTSAKRGDMARILQDGLNRNVSKSDTIQPIVMGERPETPGRFTLDNPIKNLGIAALLPAAQLAAVKKVDCEGAVWISSAVRRVRGSQTLMITLCLFPYIEGYHLDVYAVDIKEKGGGLSARLGRAIGQAIVGDSDHWTNKTIIDVVRHVRKRTSATITYIEGQPEFTGTPWEEDTTLLPSASDKQADETASNGDEANDGDP